MPVTNKATEAAFRFACAIPGAVATAHLTADGLSELITVSYAGRVIARKITTVTPTHPYTEVEYHVP